MLGTLIESHAVHQRHTGSSFASILIHSVIITGGVLATAKDMSSAPQAPLEPHQVTFLRPMDAPPASRPSARASTATITSAPFVLRLTVPAIAPVGIPAVDLSAPLTPADFRNGPIDKVGILCDGDCTPSPVTDNAGRELWTARDVLMRLLEDPVPPRYPESLRRAGVEGDVVVKFVVDTTGRVDMRSIEVVRSTHSAFTDAVRETLTKLRFAPGAAGERKMRALAVMPFHFTLK